MILYWILGGLQIIIAIIVLLSEKGWVKNKKGTIIDDTTLLGNITQKNLVENFL